MTTIHAATGLAVPALSSPRARLLLVMGDDDLVNGHRASHWTGVAPVIELDLAFATIAQDGLNHADLWYQLILTDELAGNDPDVRRGVDAIALGRPSDQYRHAVVCERPPRDIAFSLARHVVVDHVLAVRAEVLSASSDPCLADLATRVRWELRYHLEHADLWMQRLCAAGGSERERFVDALAVVVPEAQGLFEPFAGESEVVADGILPVDHREIRSRWVDVMTPWFDELGVPELLEVDVAPSDASGGRDGRHTADFTDDVWPEMTALYRADPGAQW